MTSVRPYEQNDREDVIRLCLEDTGTASAGEDTRKYTALTRCEYYIDCEPRNCFVAVDDAAGVIGCILCSENTDQYERAFTEKYVPQAAAISAKRYVDAKLSLLPITMYRQFYPAHFVLFLQSSWYGVGVERLLLDALRDTLRSKKILNAMTVCDAGNEEALKAYEENGLKPMLQTKYGKAMALEIKEI
ncbi:MAG: hypothetical protein IJT27_01945 [Clostridia bacterium]|nr:hypothetical protein [Clostridia bacterium]